MEQKEFNKLFAQAMEEYQKIREGSKRESTSEDSSKKKSVKPKNESSASKGNGTASQSSDTASSTLNQNPNPNPNPNQGREIPEGYIGVTPSQVHKMYNLLRDIVTDILDPDQSWESLGNYGANIMDLLDEINPSEVADILASAVKKVRASDRENPQHRDSYADLRDALMHELSHAVMVAGSVPASRCRLFFGMPF